MKNFDGLAVFLATFIPVAICSNQCLLGSQGKGEVPDDVESSDEWLMSSASEYSTGFTMVKIEAENGVVGIALVTVRGSSWEGIDMGLAGVF